MNTERFMQFLYNTQLDRLMLRFREAIDADNVNLSNWYATKIDAMQKRRPTWFIEYQANFRAQSEAIG